MSKSTFQRVLVAESALEEAVLCVAKGAPAVLIICADRVDALQRMARELVQRLRGDEGRVEFYSTEGIEALLQAVNRLLSDIPIDQMTAPADGEGLRLLVIDGAERLEIEEAQAVRRLVAALRGSAIRILLFARLAGRPEVHSALSEFSQLGCYWMLDAQTAPPIFTFSNPQGIDDPMELEYLAPAQEEENTVDILMRLADERAKERGVDLTRRMYSFRSLMLAIVVLLVIAGTTIAFMPSATSFRVEAKNFWVKNIYNLLKPPPQLPVIFNCGLHINQEEIAVIKSYLGKGVPMREEVVANQFHLYVGPFTAKDEIERIRARIWELGSCRVNPQPFNETTFKARNGQ